MGHVFSFIFFFFAMTAFVPLFVPFSAMVMDWSRSIGHVFSLKLSHRHRMIGLRSSGVQTSWFLTLLFLFLSDIVSIIINYYTN